MEKQKTEQGQTRMTGRLSDESGAVLLTTFIFLILLSLIGIVGINIAATDLHITRNYRIHKENLMLADAAVNRAATLARNEIGEHIIGDDWIDDLEGMYNVRYIDDKYLLNPASYNWRWDPVANEIDVEAVIDSFYDDFDPVALDFEPEAEYVVFLQVSPGIPEDRDTSAVVIARSQKLGGNVVIEAGIESEDQEL